MKKQPILAFLITCWLVIVFLLYATFALLGKRDETNTYSYETTISDVAWESSHKTILTFNTNRGMAYYDPHYKTLSDGEVAENDVEMLNQLSQKGVTFKLTVADKYDWRSIIDGYKRVIAISAEDETIFSIDIHNEYNHFRKVIFVGLLSVCALVLAICTWSWAYDNRPLRKLKQKISKNIRKLKKNNV